MDLKSRTLLVLLIVVSTTSLAFGSHRRNHHHHHDEEPEVCKAYVMTGDEGSCNKCLKALPNLREKLCLLSDDEDSDFCNFEKCKFDRCCTPSDIPRTLPNGCPICFKTTI
ncbi:uncharacterized protein LOC100906104 [Galendromus occidentalis]|uniref:Uncharacterized protein LOC100906104 n=1 Tax=Galendromus occidentalis TaxID=34638 RepID=A0AAJ6QP72_9ACAR|nr:uncharacterized protein LOC100906104 [Galendromus occidentalis]